MLCTPSDAAQVLHGYMNMTLLLPVLLRGIRHYFRGGLVAYQWWVRSVILNQGYVHPQVWSTGLLPQLPGGKIVEWLN